MSGKNVMSALALIAIVSIAHVHHCIAQGVVITQPVQRYGLGTLESAALSPDGKTIATAGGIGVVIRNIDTGSLDRILTATGHEVTSAKYSPDGTRILTGSLDETAILWDLVTGEELQTFSGHSSRLNSVAFSHDGTEVLTGGDDATARLWNPESGQGIQIFDHGSAKVLSVAFSPDDTEILTGGDDALARLWDKGSGQLIRSFDHLSGAVRAVAFSPDGMEILTGNEETTVTLWNKNTGGRIREFNSHANAVRAVAFSPDAASILSGADDATAKLWSTDNGMVIQNFPFHAQSVHSVEFSSDGMHVMTASRDGSARLQTLSGDLIHELTGHNSDLFSVAYTLDSTKVLTGTNEGSAYLWDNDTGAVVHKFQGIGGPVRSVAISPDGLFAVVGSIDGMMSLWDLNTGNQVREIGPAAGLLRSVAFSPDGSLVLTASTDLMARFWDVQGGFEFRSFFLNDSPNAALFSPDGNRFLVAYNTLNQAVLLDKDTGGEITTYIGHTGAVRSIAFSPDGTQVLTGSNDMSAILWNTETGESIRTFSGHLAPIWSVAFSPDGTRILTGSFDTTAKLWNAESGEEICTYMGHTGPIRAAVYSPDGNSVATVSLDGVALRWEATGFTTASTTTTRTRDKLIIVAGGGDSPNPIADQTRNLANLAHLTATIRGYSSDDIFYLSSIETPAQNPRVDAVATSGAILDAIEDWGSDAFRLTVMLLDHGTYNTLTDRWFFIVDDDGISVRDSLAADTLDTVLDSIQTGSDPLNKVILYVDMCYAGGFVRECGEAPPGADRLVIASTTDGRLANFGGPNGEISFTGYFLSSALLGRTYRDSFNAARSAIVSLNIPAGEPQVPWLEDNGDGAPGPADGALAARNVFGSLPAFGALTPQITGVRPIVQLDSAAETLIWCETGEEVAPRRVEAVVSWSGQDYFNENGNGQPITTQSIVSLVYNLAEGRFEATLTADALADPGTYTILYRAVGDDGLGVELYGEPATGLIVNAANAARAAWLIYE